MDSLVIPNPISPMVVAEFPKTFDRQCICRRIFVSLEKIFHFKYSQTIFHLVFTWNIYGKSVTRTFLGALFWAPIPFKRYQNTSGCRIDWILFSFSILAISRLITLWALLLQQWDFKMLQHLSVFLIVRRGVKSPPEKTQSDLKNQFPPEITLLKFQQKLQAHLKCKISCSLPFRIHTSKSFQDDWSQVNNRQTFTDRHLLIPIN